ncbi:MULTISPECIES: hypothetical protein [Clostridium]|jgi:hypothetical protein|uniref:Transmembrane protein n=2 Tax=Clostridium beijerinckii TaxID=1520 RepID=A0AAE2UXY9_CLOBE|nr:MULTISPECIES: hypothetical protein [Clostridium]ABR36349.1 transmembrane protein [Clostridium beijerinckii NCIMB 8052]AIU01353.1 transmembrane protein [Clostridium beijerinckii ATCC 35702]MBF7809005.1 hypothetical protein [Clostridium beijerinckii]NRT22589.1 hypothetical protein [Clostridium beijerinckii]NRT64894.1 hypothetical protein [Clostridium beijerinckii]
MKNILNRINSIFKNINYPLAAFFLVIIIGIFTLFIKPIIGMADNGDFYRVISSNGVYELNPNDSDLYNGYFYRHYGIYKYNNDIEKNFISTQGIFIKIAVYISQMINKNFILDIRFMSWMFLFVEAIGIYLIVKVLINQVTEEKHKLIITLVTIFIFCDTTYLAYYNSFYGEAINISFFLLSIGILLNMAEFNKFSKLNILLFGISSFIFLGSKQQLSPVGILIAVLCLRIGFKNKEKLFKGLSMVLAIGFVISSILFYKQITGDFQYINGYHAMNRGILLYEEDPDEVMKFFNLNEQYSLLKDTTFYDDVTLVNLYDKQLIEDYYKKFTTTKIISYYITNPRAFFKMLKIAFDNGYSIRPNAMGNYEKSENKEFGAKSYFFALYSTVKEKVFTGNIVLSIIVIIGYCYSSAVRYIKARKINCDTMIFKEEAYFYIFLVGISQIIISVIGAGDADLAKHVFMYNMSFDLILIYFISIKLQKHQVKIKSKNNK